MTLRPLDLYSIIIGIIKVIKSIDFCNRHYFAAINRFNYFVRVITNTILTNIYNSISRLKFAVKRYFKGLINRLTISANEMICQMEGYINLIKIAIGKIFTKLAITYPYI